MNKTKIEKVLTGKQYIKKKDREITEVNILPESEKLIELKPTKSWTKKTKEAFNTMTKPLLRLGILFQQDVVQLYLAFDIYNRMQKLEKDLNDFAKNKDLNNYYKFNLVYSNLLNRFLQITNNYFVNPKMRMKILEILHHSEKEKKDENIIDIIGKL